MTMAIVGLPAGLAVTAKVLDDMKKAELFDFWELRGREIILYWRGMAPRERKTLTIDVIARIPGLTRGPASRAYLYYSPESKTWNRPLAVEIRTAK